MPLVAARLAPLAVALFLLGAVLVPAPAEASTAGVEVELTRLVNEARASRGVGPVRVDVRLVAGARAWSAHMAAELPCNTPQHDPVIQQQLPPGWTSWAENVACTPMTSGVARELHDQLMGSTAGHRENILDPRFTDLGIGIATAGGRTYVTQRFTAGAPASVAAAVEPTARLAEQHFGGGKAQHAVIARDDVYADALAAGPLARGAGPILLTPPGPVLHPRVRLALERALPSGGTVWLAGGTAAVSTGVAHELDAAGWRVRRLAGRTRTETAAVIAREVARRDGRPSTVMVATAAGWPDAAAGGAYGAATGTPVLLSWKDWVPEETATALDDLAPRRVVALGGTAVLSTAVVTSLDAERVAGPSRQGTSAAVAERLWDFTDDGPARWMATPAYGDDAWTWALGASPVAARKGAPVLLLGSDLPSGVRDYLEGLGYGGGDTAALLQHGPVPPATAAEVEALLR